jgi:colicin import membrane protein
MDYSKELESEERKENVQGLLASVFLHLTLVLLFTVKSIFFTTEPIDYSAAIRVDLVGLPDKLDPSTILPPKQEKAEAPPSPAEPKPTEPAPPAKMPEKVDKAEPKEPVMAQKPKEKDFKKQQNEALNKLKAMAALDKIKKDSVQNQKSDLPANYQVKGNVLSPGTALTGLDRINHESYLSALDQHIKQFWSLPEWLASQDLKAQVRVQIDRSGNLVGKKLVRSSGNSTYDDYALETIERSVPFPKPPDKLSAIMEVNGFLVGFPE